ncbi:galactose oxidase-like domain-containing protein [Massilia sp. TN1-12]|uniref:galactose oxidase-like domain-containing protein n=1 Tax=Massilia paldalensis TaxID=3377675 RepID=UPI00384AC2B0
MDGWTPAFAQGTWIQCAQEGQDCTFSGTRQVRYGANGSYAYQTATGSIGCNNDVFGDPAFGVGKACDYAGDTTTPPAASWVQCALEDQVCTFSGTRQVRYGANGQYAYQTATASIACTNAVFGDPAYGFDKVCSYADSTTTPAPTSGEWTRCAAEDQTCTFEGTRQVRYGANGSYAYQSATNSIQCSNAVFGDPAYGVAKFCDVQGATTTTTLPSALTGLIPFPIVPVAAANLPNGKVVTWAAFSPTTFSGDNGFTATALFDPATLSVTQRWVAETGHDMFCPGTSLLADGRLLVNGGSSSQKTSIYDFANDTWGASYPMQVARGYQGNATLSNGNVLTLGGSWSGPIGDKNGEIWRDGAGWTLMSGIPIAPFITPDPDGVYRGDNHLWLFSQAGGRVFQAGPGVEMHWIDTNGSGAVTSAGRRGDDVSSMNGNAVMYDIGKILKTGGAQAYEEVDATAAAYTIDISGGSARVKKLSPMRYARAMHNSVVLPNGQVVILGGQTYVKIFSDDRSVLMTEIWDPRTEAFTPLRALTVPRNYHSFSLLLPDGRVLIGGGGLCDFNCTTNHLDAQILTPPYLLNANGTAASRPNIVSAARQARYGGTIAATTNRAVSQFVLMRLSAVTHSLNNDQRRVPLTFTTTGATSYTLRAPANAGIAPPGYYMLFALDANGVPSVAWMLQLR